MTTLQRTTEWHLQRLGKPTASRFADIKPGRSKTEKWSQTTLTYMRELLSERLTGQWSEQYGPAIEWGLEHEDEARELYESRYGWVVERIGFVERNGIGGSPDGLVGSDGCIEIKCPFNSGHHIDYILNGCDDHMPQIQGNMYLNDRQWCDFISYDPRMPEELRLFVKRIPRDDAYIADMIARVKEFEADIIQAEETIRKAVRI